MTFSNWQSSWLQKLTVVVLAILLMFNSGCSSKVMKKAAARKSQLVFASSSDPTTFNPPINTSLFSRIVYSFIFDSLIRENGLTAELEPALAESWEISPDKTEIVFTLRQGLKWSDGHPFTADDIVFTYNDIYFNPKIPAGVRDILTIGRTGELPTVTKIDERKVKFKVPEPFAPFLRYAGGITILPRHILAKSVETKDSKGNLAYLKTWTTDTPPSQIVGNGAYRLVEYIPSQRLIFERNPYYWRKDAAGNQQPYIERIVVQIIQSDQNQLIAFRSGELDNIDVTAQQFRLLKRQEKQGKYTIYNAGAESGSRFISFNLNKGRDESGKPFVDPVKSGWFNQKAFRQAIAYAIDRETMKNNIYRGLGEVQHSPIWQESPYYLSPEAGLKTYDYQPEKAKQLLKEAGFKYNAAGQLLDQQNNLVKFSILVKSEEKARVDAAVQIQQDLKKVGIATNLDIISFNTVINKLTSRKWECYVGGFGGGGIEPHSSFNIWSSTGFLHQFNQGPIPGREKIQGWQVSDWEKEIDQLFEQGVKELDEAKRKAIYARFQAIVAEQVPFLYLVNSLSLTAVRDHIENIKFTPYGGAFWNLEELKVEAE